MFTAVTRTAASDITAVSASLPAINNSAETGMFKALRRLSRALRVSGVFPDLLSRPSHSSGRGNLIRVDSHARIDMDKIIAVASNSDL
ncbi:MAG: hypothetical protein A4E53_00122 [Pelotomaculum sp. PtaB.Bin104]|nr:MAG: hypothetical protein A4E53_00122 [Pelotomaculum sp. PtaB.Bin104]